MPDITLADLDVCPQPAPIARISMQPSEVTVRVGSTSQITVLGVDERGDFVLCAPQLVLTSADQATASVSPSGLVTGVSVGTTYVRAVGGGTADSIRVTVSAASLKARIRP